MIGKWLELRWTEKSFSSKLKRGRFGKFIEYGSRDQRFGEEKIIRCVSNGENWFWSRIVCGGGSCFGWLLPSWLQRILQKMSASTPCLLKRCIQL